MTASLPKRPKILKKWIALLVRFYVCVYFMVSSIYFILLSFMVIMYSRGMVFSAFSSIYYDAFTALYLLFSTKY